MSDFLTPKNINISIFEKAEFSEKKMKISQNIDNNKNNFIFS